MYIYNTKICKTGNWYNADLQKSSAIYYLEVTMLFRSPKNDNDFLQYFRLKKKVETSPSESVC